MPSWQSTTVTTVPLSEPSSPWPFPMGPARCEALPLLAALSPGFWMTAGPWKSIGSALTGRVTLAACCTGLHGGRPGRWDTSGSSHTPCQKKVGQVCELLAGNSLAGVVAEIGMYRAGLGLIPILYCAAKSCFGRHKNKWCIATWIFPFHTKIRIAARFHGLYWYSNDIVEYTIIATAVVMFI
jgi:hypothetical protein